MWMNQVTEIRRLCSQAMAFDVGVALRDLGAAETLTKQMAEIQKQARDAFKIDIHTTVGDLASVDSVTKQMAEIQKQAREAMTFDVGATLRIAATPPAWAGQLAEAQRQVREALTFDVGTMLGDLGVATALTEQVAEVRRLANEAMTFDVGAALRSFDLDAAYAALADQDVVELERVMPPGVDPGQETLLASIAAVLALAIVLSYLRAGLEHLAVAAVENVADTTSLILEAVDAISTGSPEVRGLLVLLYVASAIRSMRA
jgi:hypothetical protein